MIRRGIQTLVAVLAIHLALLTTACQKVEQGYWTKPGSAETQFNADYRRDFADCVRQGWQRGTVEAGDPETDAIRTRHLSGGRGANAFNECMVARGYVWVNLQPLVKSPSDSITSQQAQHCPQERIIIDPFGYPHCASTAETMRARPVDKPSPPPSAPPSPLQSSKPERGPTLESRPTPESRPTQESRPTTEGRPTQRRAFDEALCIQFSQSSLSNPYETFLRCMAEKGWQAETP